MASRKVTRTSRPYSFRFRLPANQRVLSLLEARIADRDEYESASDVIEQIVIDGLVSPKKRSRNDTAPQSVATIPEDIVVGIEMRIKAELRQWIESLISNPERLTTLQAVSETYADESAIPDDVIDNILADWD